MLLGCCRSGNPEPSVHWNIPSPPPTKTRGFLSSCGPHCLLQRALPLCCSALSLWHWSMLTWDQDGADVALYALLLTNSLDPGSPDAQVSLLLGLTAAALT
eukprot:GHUV01032101.1.p3 GENE.GHUV01032101.1~~GHUV01032101.1.p3  ORF type:complete len:101 (+),score=15.10 GHUV01032101.1:411-713(+)